MGMEEENIKMVEISNDISKYFSKTIDQYISNNANVLTVLDSVSVLFQAYSITIGIILSDYLGKYLEHIKEDYNKIAFIEHYLATAEGINNEIIEKIKSSSFEFINGKNE